MICAEMGCTYPEQGGIYAWVRSAFGGRWGSRVSWGYWVNTAVWIPAIFILFAGILKQLNHPNVVEYIEDFAVEGRAYFTDQYPVEAKAIKRNITKHDNIYDLRNTLGERFAALDDFSTEQIETVARQLADELEVKPGVLINGARTVITGQLAGPGIFDVLAAIGQERVVQRLKNARQIIEKGKE